MPVAITCEKCGTIRHVPPSLARQRFCGVDCWHAASRGSLNMKHGGTGSRLYRIWTSMKRRGQGLGNRLDTKYYSGRVAVCGSWLEDFRVFQEWAFANGYRDDLELDRIDPNGNYEPSNCRWATRSQQMANTRKRADGWRSKFKGVSRFTDRSRYFARIGHGGKMTHLGHFDSQLLAARAYDAAAFAIHGEFARVNFPEAFRRTEAKT